MQRIWLRIFGHPMVFVLTQCKWRQNVREFLFLRSKRFIASRPTIIFITPPPSYTSKGGVEGFRQKSVGQPTHVMPSLK